jgi:hypothetical protein
MKLWLGALATEINTKWDNFRKTIEEQNSLNTKLGKKKKTILTQNVQTYHRDGSNKHGGTRAGTHVWMITDEAGSHASNDSANVE